MSTMITLRRTVKEAALAALSAKERDWRLEAAQAEIAELTLAVKSRAVELAVARGEAAWG